MHTLYCCSRVDLKISSFQLQRLVFIIHCTHYIPDHYIIWVYHVSTLLEICQRFMDIFVAPTISISRGICASQHFQALSKFEESASKAIGSVPACSPAFFLSVPQMPCKALAMQVELEKSVYLLVYSGTSKLSSLLPLSPLCVSAVLHMNFYILFGSSMNGQDSFFLIMTVFAEILFMALC